MAGRAGVVFNSGLFFAWYITHLGDIMSDKIYYVKYNIILFIALDPVDGCLAYPPKAFIG
jgi:hypothetical protein